MTTKGDYYAPPEAYQQSEGARYKDQDYEVIEAGGFPSTTVGGGGSALDLEKQLRLGEENRGGGEFGVSAWVAPPSLSPSFAAGEGFEPGRQSPGCCEDHGHLCFVSHAESLAVEFKS